MFLFFYYYFFKLINFSENPYEKLKNLETEKPLSKNISQKRDFIHQTTIANINGEDLNLKQFIELQMKRAETSTIKELKQEIETDLKLLMSPEFIEETKYEIFLCNF